MAVVGAYEAQAQKLGITVKFMRKDEVHQEVVLGVTFVDTGKNPYELRVPTRFINSMEDAYKAALLDSMA